ncbi:MAG: rod shape-determining protein RodA [Alphaproteobacteria bacterium]
MARIAADQGPMRLSEKLREVNWPLIVLLGLISSVGFAMLYSAANGNLDPWASRQMVRFAAGVVLMLGVALIDIRHLLRYAYLAYLATLGLLVVVEVAGEIGMGAQRWIDVGFFQIQPSEIMKITLVLALARYFHTLAPEDVVRPHYLIIPLLMVLVPVGLVLKQPDLGTALILLIVGGVMFFLGGVRVWKFVVVFLGGLGMIPIAWRFLREYQKRRVLIFLDPESDPLGSGYHIMQSKIALGSGGMFGKGFLMGTQSHLNFLPEKQTDFIFTMLAEEFGLAGSLALLSLYLLVLVYGLSIALRCRHQFGRLLAMGITTGFFLSVFVNTAMVMGLIPVVGAPLPLISYGGSAMMTILMGFGLVISAYIHRDAKIPRRPGMLDG